MKLFTKSDLSCMKTNAIDFATDVVGADDNADAREIGADFDLELSAEHDVVASMWRVAIGIANGGVFSGSSSLYRCLFSNTCGESDGRNKVKREPKCML